MGSIHRIDRPKPWRATYRDDTGRQRSKTHKRKVDAERWLREREREVDRGEHVDPSGGRVLVGERAELWLAGQEVKRSTAAFYTSLVNAHVLPEFGNLELRRVTVPRVRAWLAEMAEDGLSPSTRKSARFVLYAVVQQAVDDGLLVRNVVEKVDAPSASARRQLFLTAEQLTALAEACETRREGAGALMRFLGWTGCRLGEAVALRWHSVDVPTRRARIEVNSTEVHGRLVHGTPKGNEPRTVIIPAMALPGPEGDPDDLVFTAPLGGPVRAPSLRNTVWKPAVTATDGAPAGLNIHDLRHTAASLMIASGASIKAVQRQLGHKSAAMTLDLYGHLYDEDLEDLADRLEARYADAQGTRSDPEAVT